MIEDRRRVAVWDLPTRLFHWTLVLLIAFSWWSQEEDHIEWHLWSGFAVLTLLVFRLLWGLVGSSTARFSTFIRGPRTLLGYMREMKGWKGIGHSPLGALSVLGLLFTILVIVVSGLIQPEEDGVIPPLTYAVPYDVSDAAHDIHEVAFDVLVILIGLHVAALLFYRVILGKKLVGPMITGRADLPADTEPMRPGRGWAAILCLLIAVAFTCWIIAGAPPLGT